MRTTSQLISETRNWVRHGDLERLTEYFYALDQNGLDLPMIFSRLFINSCNYGQLPIAQWLYELYLEFPLVTQIALRPSFNYCRARARIRKDKQMVAWLATTGKLKK